MFNWIFLLLGFFFVLGFFTPKCYSCLTDLLFCYRWLFCFGQLWKMQLRFFAKSEEMMPFKEFLLEILKILPFKKLTLFTFGCIYISQIIEKNSNKIDYCPNNSSLDCYTQNVVLDIFEEVSEVSPARSFLIVVNVVLRLFNSAKNYIIKPKSSFFVLMYCHTMKVVWRCNANSNILTSFNK